MRGHKRHYRIINQVCTQENTSPSPFTNRRLLQKLTQSLIKQKKFMYIDINEEQGFKIMKECESSDEDDQVQKIGQKYLVNLNNLFTKNSKGLSYVYRSKEESKKKDHALELLKQQIKRSTEKIEKIGKTKIDELSYETKTPNNKSALERYVSIKVSKEGKISNDHSHINVSPHLNKSSRYYKTISFENKSSLSRSQTPKKLKNPITPNLIKNLLPDIKKGRKNSKL